MAQPITKRGSVFKTTTDSQSGTVTFECIPTGERKYLNVNMLATTIAVEAMMHGVKQKVTDAAASPAGSATTAERWEAMLAVISRITGENATWNAAPAGPSGPKLGVLLEAIMTMRGEDMADTETVEARRKWLADKTSEQRAALKSHPKIAPIIAQIEARKAKTTLDSDSLLAELD